MVPVSCCRRGAAWTGAGGDDFGLNKLSNRFIILTSYNYFNRGPSIVHHQLIDGCALFGMVLIC